MLNRIAANVTGWKLYGDSGFKPDDAGQHSCLTYAQAGDIMFEPFLISNDIDLKFFKERKWAIYRVIATAITTEAGAAWV